jgi:histone arginine demethylase JMJD6
MDPAMHTAAAELRTLPIQRVHGLTPEIFHLRQLAGYGMPVIVTGAMNSWPALSRWSFGWFKTRYGSDNVAPRIYGRMELARLMKLSDFLDYLDEPEAESPGLWVDPKTRYPCKGPGEKPSSPLYLAWSVFADHPELLEDIELSPKFVEDWLPFLPEAFHNVIDQATRYFSAGVMIGPRDAQVGLHYDVLETHAYLAQIIGRKKCVLFSPEDSDALYDGKVNPDAPDFEKFQKFRSATAYEGTLHPGEILFIPSRWWHYVVALEKTITVNYNFFNRVNFAAYLTHILRDLPAVVKALEQLPDQKAALGIAWTSQGFDFPESPKV